MYGRCGSLPWMSETARRKRRASDLPWEARSITPELTRCVGCAPEPRCPRPPIYALWHEAESELPISVYERALSASVLCQ
jgi:hypothetical protein